MIGIAHHCAKRLFDLVSHALSPFDGNYLEILANSALFDLVSHFSAIAPVAPKLLFSLGISRLLDLVSQHTKHATAVGIQDLPPATVWCSRIVRKNSWDSSLATVPG